MKLLITGASGGVGRLLRPRLAAAGRTLRLVDVAAGDPPAPGEAVELVTASVTDLDAMTEACRDVDAVLHLGGESLEAPWEDILHANVHGTYCVLEAAHRAGVHRVLLASSNHAAGFHARDDAPPEGLPADVAPRPDTYYGWSKAAIESLGRLYVDRYGMDVICLRIGSCFPAPGGLRGLMTWLSPDDCARLVEACLTAPRPGFRIIWGISRNTRRWWSLAEGEALGYHPVDDSEVFADDYLTSDDTIDDATADDRSATRLLGGIFCRHPLGHPMR